MKCLYGTERKEGSPDYFTIDTGAFCFILGIESGLCPLLDRIPSLIGKPWKEILETVIIDSIGIVIDSVNGIDVTEFCATEFPQPPDITYSDVFGFLISYVPPFSLLDLDSSLLGKITRFFLYSRWNQYCKCREREEEPPPLIGTPIPPFVGICPDSQAAAGQLNLWINQVNQQNTVLVTRYFYGTVPFNLSDGFIVQYETSKALYDQVMDLGNNPEFILVSELPILRDEPRNTAPFKLGCLDVVWTYQSDYIEGFQRTYDYNPVGSQGGQVFHFVGKWTRRYQTLTWDETECCYDPTPPPVLPPPPSNCPPPPSPEFCRKFPNDPLCSNCPNCPPCPECPECPDCPDIEPTTIEVRDYLCISGLEFKEVEWNL